MQHADPTRRRRRGVEDPRGTPEPFGEVPNYQAGDPLRYDRLPSSAVDTELDFVPPLFDDAGGRPHWFLAPLLLAGLLLGSRFVFAVLSWEGSGLALLSLVAFTTLVAAYEFFLPKNNRAALAWLLGGPLAVVALTAQTPLVAFLLFVCAAVLTLGLASSCAQHFGSYLHARTLSPREIRERWSRFWHDEGVLARIRRAAAQPWRGVTASVDADLVARRETAERAAFDRGFLIIALALAVGFIVFVATPIPLFAGPIAVATVTAIVWAYALLNVKGYARTKDKRPVLREALQVWFSYGDEAEQAPGVFRSTAGLARRRRKRTSRAYSFLAVSVVLLGSYFPVQMLFQGPAAWQQENHELTMRRLGEDAPSLAKSRAQLPETTRSFAEHVPADVREAYLEAAARTRFAGEVRKLEATEYLPLARVPESWVLLSLHGLLGDPVQFGFALVLGLLLSVFFPPLLFAGFALAIGGRAALHHAAGFDAVGAPYIKPQPAFAVLTDRLRHSRNEDERRHLWIGRSAEWGYPVLLDRDALERPAHILGGTGSGKTARGVAPLINQLIRPDCSVLVIDLKGDQALFEEARSSAAREGSVFKWFTSRSRQSTHVFNPLDQPHMRELTALERTEIFTKALGLEYGEGYGRSHFSRKNRQVLLKLFDLDPEIRSFVRMHQRVTEAETLKKLGTKESLRDAGDLFAVIEALARLESLNVTDTPWPQRKNHDGAQVEDPITPDQRAALLENSIRMAEALERPSVYYFKLPASIHSASDREIGKFALYALLTAAEGYRGDTRLPVYVVIDEFQQIVSEDLDTFFRQARSMGVHFILANQTPSDLEKAGADLLDSIHNNTGFQLIYSVGTERYRRTLEALSGNKMHVLMSATESDGGTSVTTRQQLGPRFLPNDLIELSARDEECWVNIKQNKGFAQFDGYPFVGLTDFHISKTEYEARERAGWPSVEDSPGTLATPLAWNVTVKPPRGKKTKATKKPTKPQPPDPVGDGLAELKKLQEEKHGEKDD
ncbi:MAG: type IV secretion system DNA-binding domain-containing protein [Candidatus Eisenbacteria bacterium]